MAEGDGKFGGVFDENAGLFFGTGDDDDAEVRRLEGGVEGLDVDGGGLAPLAIAAEHEVFGGGVEDFDLSGAGCEAEVFLGPFGGFCWLRGGVVFGRGWACWNSEGFVLKADGL